jgi:hypothetical protein
MKYKSTTSAESASQSRFGMVPSDYDDGRIETRLQRLLIRYPILGALPQACNDIAPSALSTDHRGRMMLY